MPKKLVMLTLTCLMLSLFSTIVSASTGEIDKIAVVSRVVDGDTFDLDSGERIRFADVNTPEKDTVGYQEAKDYVISLVEGKTVYLDIDDVYGTDTGGDRLVAVVYFDYNSSHYVNLNKALLEKDYAVIWEHDNEFNPSNWSLYVPKTAIPEFPIIIVLVFVIVPVSLLLLRLR